jgi:hypothetical protein
MDLETIQEEYNNGINHIITTIKLKSIPPENNKWFIDIKYILEDDIISSNNEQAILLYEVLALKLKFQPYDKQTIRESIYKLENDNYRNNIICETLSPDIIKKEIAEAIKKDIEERIAIIAELKKYI